MLTFPSLKPSILSSSESRFFSSISQSSVFDCVRCTWRSAGLRQKRTVVKALDAAQAFDHEALMTLEFERKSKLKIAVVGFGNFGQFIAKALVRQGHTVLAHSRSDYSSVARELGVAFFSDAHDLCEEHPEVVLLCTSIISTEAVLRSLPLQRLKRSTLFVDVLSVKEFPRRLFLQILPPEFDIICTHPMFGPESGKNGWTNLPFVYEKTRIGDEEARADRCDRFLEIFANEGCRMVEMSCAEHDRHAAETQFITHTVGRMLGRLQLQSTPINTKGYETLLNLVENTCGDSFDLYYGLFMYNVNATEQIERLEIAFDSLKKELFGHLHDILRRQIFMVIWGGWMVSRRRWCQPSQKTVMQKNQRMCKRRILSFFLAIPPWKNVAFFINCALC